MITCGIVCCYAGQQQLGIAGKLGLCLLAGKNIFRRIGNALNTINKKKT